MNILSMFSKDACSIDGKNSVAWTWNEYYAQKKVLEKNGTAVILVDMINHPVPDSTPISNELFEQQHPDSTMFVLYCHSGGTSGMMQKKLTPLFPRYTFVNMKGGIGAYTEPAGK